jgi:two-component system, NarL family, sensor kinase
MAVALVEFVLIGLVATAVVGVVGIQVLRDRGRRESVRNARDLAELAGRGIIEPELSNRLLAGDRRARAHMDRIVERRVVREPVVRMKVWSASGRIVYSDERRLVGVRMGLGEDGRAALRAGRPAAHVSDLREPENRFERRYGKLLEVYVPVRAADGQWMLSEAYIRFSSVTANSHRLFVAFVPALLGGLLVLELLQLPLAWSLARRLHRGQREREALWHRALDASQRERQRMTRDLHDGVVQDLNAVWLGLAAAASEAPRDAAAALQSGAARVREAARDLRAAIANAYPPDPRREGLAAALTDLAGPLSENGVAVAVDAPPQLQLPGDVEALVLRAAQEALLNVARHAEARSARVAVRRPNGVVELTVSDDGEGFDQGNSDGEDAHLGLRLLEDAVREAGGRIEIESARGRGSCVRVEVPA